MKIFKIIIIVLFFVVPMSVLADEVPVVEASPSVAISNNVPTINVNQNEAPVDNKQPLVNSVASQQPVVATPSTPEATTTPAKSTAGFFSRLFHSSASANETKQIQQPMTIDVRVAKLEQQINYLQQLNVPAQVGQLQQSIEELRGLIEVQAHQIKQLSDQQRTLYGDLDKRIASLSAGDVAKTAAQPTATLTQSPADVNLATVTKETQAYQNAFKLITNKQYSDAISALQNYLEKYPAGRFVVNAHYWLGELYAIAGDNNKAANEFNIVVTNYGDSSKASDALLKLGQMAFDKTQFDQAKQYWQTVVRKYPDSSAARIASMQLRRMQKQ